MYMSKAAFCRLSGSQAAFCRIFFKGVIEKLSGLVSNITESIKSTAEIGYNQLNQNTDSTKFIIVIISTNVLYFKMK